MLWVKNHLFLRFAFQAEVRLASRSPILRPGELQQLEILQAGCFWQLHHGRAQVCSWLVEQPPTLPLPSPSEGTLRRYEGFRGSPRAIPVPPRPENNNKPRPPIFSQGLGSARRGRPRSPVPRATARERSWPHAWLPLQMHQMLRVLHLAHLSCNCNSLNYHTVLCADIS